MDKNSKFTKKLLIEIGIALAIIIPLFIGVAYIKSNIENRVEGIINQRNEVATKTNQLNSLVTLRNQYNNFGEEAIEVMRGTLPTRDDLLDISEDFQELGASEGVGFGFSYLSEQEASGSNLGFINFRLNIEANSLNQVSNLIERVESFKYLTQVDKVSIQGSGDNISSSIEGKVFFR